MATLDAEVVTLVASPRPVPAYELPTRGNRLHMSGDCIQSRADAMAIRDALVLLSSKLSARCLTVNALNLAREGVTLGRAMRPDEIGVFGSLILPFAIVSMRTWPTLRHFELDMFATEIVQAKIVTRWAREALGTKAWACEIKG